MSPEEHEMLKRTAALAEENNDILRSMRRSMRWARFMTVVYWVIIIGISVGAYYFFQPYFQKAVNLYNSAQTNIDGMGKVLDTLK